MLSTSARSRMVALGGSATSEGFKTKGPTPKDTDIPTQLINEEIAVAVAL